MSIEKKNTQADMDIQQLIKENEKLKKEIESLKENVLVQSMDDMKRELDKREREGMNKAIQQQEAVRRMRDCIFKLWAIGNSVSDYITRLHEEAEDTGDIDLHEIISGYILWNEQSEITERFIHHQMEKDTALFAIKCCDCDGH